MIQKHTDTVSKAECTRSLDATVQVRNSGLFLRAHLLLQFAEELARKVVETRSNLLSNQVLD